jgi:myo-inositol-1(or 4)-monophosphatase
MVPAPDLLADLELMRGAVADAAAVARRIYEEGFETWRKEGQQPVTEVDMAVNAHLEKHLRQARPNYGWLSEETKDDRSRFACRRVWVIDPIDGTRALMKGKPHFVISVALLDDSAPVLGILHNPVTQEHYEAVTGSGATLNGQPIHVTDCQTLDSARLQMYSDFVASKRWKVPFPRVETGMVNSIAYRLALVAAGQYDGVLTIRHKNDWDLAAAALVVTEAGGRVTDRTGQPFTFNGPDTSHNGVIAGCPALHAQIVERLATDFE